jgi:D-alanyl-lipoteichoic acid acyltransferase DltB (MBOAT superfamily)
MFFKPEYIIILLFTIIIDYAAGIYLEQSENKKNRKALLIMSIVANVGILVFFKYYNFINENITGLIRLLGYKGSFPYLNIVLPIGLSFHTFQAMSYTIEVYRRRFKAERHFGIYALYVMFYPQLVAGPIERPQNIIPQFRKKQHFQFENATIGLNLIFWGLFKKVVIADRLAIYVNQVYGGLDRATSLSVILAVIFFSFQIYCDFSGYSDIARGTARFMGYDLMINFKQPYLSKSLTEFWSKWHISLSTWFRDYVYIPLGGSKAGSLITYRNLFIVFLLSGFWHGASWTFIIWGLIHVVLLILEKITLKIYTRISTFMRFVGSEKILNGASIIFVFSLVSFAWIFFRAQNFDQAIKVLHKIIHFEWPDNLAQLSAYEGPFNLFLCFLGIFVLLATRSLPQKLEKKGSLAFAVACSLAIFFLGTNGTNEFIYFQF